MFTENEIAYLKSQPLARIATVAPDGQPDAVPVGFEFDGEHIYVGGHNPAKTRKYNNVRDGNDKVALLVDDLESITPWRPRGIRIYGIAKFVEREGMFGPGIYMRITPTTSWSWAIEKPPFSNRGFGVHKTIHGGMTMDDRRRTNDE
jgi:pyridoxamine 5'-phosphate oxidase family protein